MTVTDPKKMSAMGARSSAGNIARDHARMLRQRAHALEVIAGLADKHLTPGSEEEDALWGFICSLPNR